MLKAIAIILALLIVAPSVFAQEPASKIYPFAMDYDPERNLLLSIPAPAGYDRFPMKKMSRFMAWLTNLPLKPKHHPVIRHNNQIIMRSDSVGGVLDFGISSKNQQDADMPIHIVMEYLRTVGKIDDFYFYIESGDSVSYGMWINGKFSKDAKGNFKYIKGEKRKSDLNEFYRFAEFVFSHNNRQSLEQSLTKTDGNEIIPGDIFIVSDEKDPDGEGFTAMVMDVCSNDKGEYQLLIAWGGRSAQSYYIPRPLPLSEKRWFTVDELRSRLAEYGQGSFYRYGRILNL